ncbi:EAL domain-containing protein [Maridesulfovibrio hydrothermalis]|uniref:Diguanylate cyclase/phosphodiesterase with PAS/PAC sensor(S) n=1 Tax=Maridesulfovibrio hydrothermalis AM13 = DSM 14728 TaxID=1121451 RepID=L0R5V5_9BACT|nr:EAL domain-containing protein [Maridesulfovibrio hydrothermalis]CCO22068.1 Diguanylate cyclase/phosphodiesterase with PAS/PAC sensor(S) [Maridesulfovibrio hydrothermalis AM13 = DSM 14728]
MSDQKAVSKRSIFFFKKGERSISRDLSACLVFALAIIIGLVTAYEYFGRSKMLRQEFEDKADTYIEQLTKSVTFPIWNFDMGSLKHVCSAYTQNEQFSKLKITDFNGDVLFNFVRPGEKDDNPVVRTRDLYIDKEKIGTIRLELTSRIYRRNLEWILFVSSLTFLTSVAVIYVITGFLLDYFIRNPLARLRKGMDKVAMGDFSYRFEEFQYIELLEIGSRFNRMTEEIASRESRLEEVNKALQGEVLKREKAAKSLIKSEKRYRALVETTSEGFFMIDDNQVLLDVNPAFCRMIGLAREDVLGAGVASILGEVAAARFSDRQSGDYRFELSFENNEGREIDIFINATHLYESDLDTLTFAFITDISSYKLMEKALRGSEEEYRTIAEYTFDWEMWIGPTGSVKYVSPSCERISGYPKAYFMEGPMRVENILHKNDREYWQSAMSGNFPSVDGTDMRLFRRDGLLRWVSLTGHQVNADDGTSLGLRISLRDITKRKFMEKQLQYEALHDPLTGLANRTLCCDRIRQAVERSRRRDNYFYAVVFMDLDRFKIINDSLGHNIGDKLLVEVSKRLLQSVRELDTVSRFGGDEFIVVLEESASPREGVRIVRRIRDNLRVPMMIDGHKINVAASYGILLSPTNYDKPEEIIQNANVAMHQAKEAGRDRIKVFNKRMLDQAVKAMQLESDLRAAMASDELFLDYQPIYSIENNETVGFEALIRWNHPRRGLVMPGEFIPMAEESGLIFELGSWVITEACRQMKSWLDRYDNASKMMMSINISGRQFSQPTLVDNILSNLMDFDLPPHNIKVEITETAIMERAQQAVEMLQRLKTAGVLVSIDDFGTGYSSMSNLQEFPLDQLKIDLSFVRKMRDSVENVEIVKAIVNLAHNLGLNVVAEGVEYMEQQELLKDMGCEFGQGYLYSRPMSVENVEALFKGDIVLGDY